MNETGQPVSTGRFVAEASPADGRCDELARLQPTIPYYTHRYRTAMQSCGRQVWLLGIEAGGVLHSGCLAELQRGRLSCQLHIQSTPGDAGPDFWQGLTGFCRAEGVTELSLGTVGTQPLIPDLGVVLEARDREEYWVDLTVPELKSLMRGEQRRIFNRAVDGGLGLRQVSAAEGLASHQRLTEASLDRRRARGEAIPEFAENDIPRALLESGTARAYECVLGGQVLGSAIIAVAEAGAHGYSAGYAPEGLKAGAGVFLNFATFKLFKAEGKSLFNLGDAPPGSGLALFKKGLGGVVMPSRAARFHVGSPLHRQLMGLKSRVQGAVAGLRRRPRAG